ncbi:hypothetical protein [Dyella humicola]|uniref:hypothetical protein n=1 Tax=Dyella humicola TaxID=2992126 RepID=UPI0022534BA6|nr:hypothetical protein [Dyella humicola]
MPAARLEDTPTKADGHIVDHSTAYFPGQRFPNPPDLYRRTRSVTRRLNQFGITEDMQKLMPAPAARLDPRVIRARIGNTRCSRERLQYLAVTGD